jgi:hypothetical protein
MKMIIIRIMIVGSPIIGASLAPPVKVRGSAWEQNINADIYGPDCGPSNVLHLIIFITCELYA